MNKKLDVRFVKGFRNFYERLIQFCKKKNAKTYLYFISFIESIFFPLPTDPFLIPYVVAEKKFIKITIYVTFFSVLGGIFAYLIGYFFWVNLEPIIIKNFNSVSLSIQDFKSEFYEFGLLLIIIGGFSPFPYKITCLSSGILEINLLVFIALSLVSRGARFFLISFLANKYGDLAVNLISKYILRITFLFLVIIIILIISYF